MFIVENSKKHLISNFYVVYRRKGGEGSYACVSAAINKSTGASRACKIITKFTEDPKIRKENYVRFKREIAIQRMLDHPSICRLYETFEDKDFFYLIMEYCHGGEIINLINGEIDEDHLTEVQTAIVMQQIFRGLVYMQNHRVSHNDLKPENVMMLKDLEEFGIEDNIVRLVDFGLSYQYEVYEDGSLEFQSHRAGSVYYTSPQMLARKYDFRTDMWSCGIMMYTLMCGYPPFYGTRDAHILSKVRIGNYTFNHADWKNVGPMAKDLIRGLIRINPDDRYTPKQALHHDFIRLKAPKTEVKLTKELIMNMYEFRSMHKLKQAVLQVMVHQCSEDQLEDLKQMFFSIDEDGDGFMAYEELEQGLLKAGLKAIPDDFRTVLWMMDADGSGFIDYSEFMAACLSREVYEEEELMWHAFRVFDRDGDGKISLKDLRVIWTHDKNLCEELMEEVDVAGGGGGTADGEIEFQEFIAMMKAERGPQEMAREEQLMKDLEAERARQAEQGGSLEAIAEDEADRV